ncbi:hypothetical protein G9C98_000704 [Cotesia typhae]|uniref:cytochrome-b5 reductase n=1 Tax=Cotesia typhae TaxID=2053667 RepID=A0A8J5RHL7_9HYME|nr:hypothetical protein G9C98_000704 [Cotesia typhae]
MKNQVLMVVGAVGTLIIGGTIHYLLCRKKRIPVLLEDPSKKYRLPLIEKEIINHDTRRYRFGFPSTHVLGLPVGSYVILTAEINGQLVRHAYTPVSDDDDFGFVDLIVKVYFKNVHPKFPKGGRLTQYLDEMKIGDTIDFEGPGGRLNYHGNGKFAIRLSKTDTVQHFYNFKKVVMLAGGSGIAPMLQLIRAIAKNPSDSTQVSLLFANQTEKDILMREELEQILKDRPEQLNLWYTLDTADANWKYSTGYITADMINEHMFPPAEDTIVLMCGPKPMIHSACTLNLDKLGYDNKLRFIY